MNNKWTFENAGWYDETYTLHEKFNFYFAKDYS